MKKNNILIVSFMNLFFVVLELIGGVITGSISILSDAIHDLGDALTLFIAYFLEKKSLSKPDKKYTYGYLRYSLVGSIITALVLLLGSIFVIYSAINRIINPTTINYSGMILFAIIGLIINVIGFYLTHKTKNLNEKMISLHLLEDTLSWLLVIIISIIMLFTKVSILDPILSIVISFYILLNVVKNLKKVLEILLEKAPENINIDEILESLIKEFNIKNIHHVHIWSLDGDQNYLTMHMVIPDNLSKDKIINLKYEIKKILIKKNICHVTIEIEYEKEKCNSIECNIKEYKQEKHHHHH